MYIKENESLHKYTTIRIGGMCKNMYFPESEQELIDLVNKLSGYRILARGSNLLINDQIVFENIINVNKCNNIIKSLGDGNFYVGCSVTLQKLILEINSLGYGGIEYLFSVPGSVGGAVIMNAGRGKKFNQNISDYIIKIKVLKEGVISYINKENCDFSYRNSIFKNSDYIILGVYFNFDKENIKILEENRKKRIELCKNQQDNSAPNFGSLFFSSNKYAMKLLKKINIKCNDICFSVKTPNWILNNGNGKYNDVLELISIAKKINLLFFKKAKLEVIVWEK